MKEVIAIIRPGQWQATKAKLAELGITCFTSCRVSGRGKQNGLRFMGLDGRMTGTPFVPKRMISFWLNDAEIPRVVESIIVVNRTAAYGDGKIFICPVEDALRVRTGERGGKRSHEVSPMKMIRAVIRPEREAAVLSMLESSGFPAVTKLDVLGRGKQKGVRVGSVLYDELAKTLLILVVEDAKLQMAVEAIRCSAITGNPGDGKIIVSPVEEVYTIRTGQAGL